MKRLSVCVLLCAVSVSHAAIDAACVWEVRESGNWNNGGGFIAGASGTDYSLQDSPQIATTSLRITRGDTAQVWCVSGGNFSATSVGNILHIVSGTGFTPGWYEITAWDGNDAVLDRSAGSGGSSSGVANMGGAISLSVGSSDAIAESLRAGHTMWIKSGSYTLADTFNPSDTTYGTATAPVVISGYHSVRGDDVNGVDRPLITCGGYTFQTGSSGGPCYYQVSNLRLTGTASAVTNFYHQTIVRNVQSHNTNVGSAFQTTQQALLIDCEGIADGGSAWFTNGTRGAAYFCHFHDSGAGATLGYGDAQLYGCVLANNTVGLNVGSMECTRVLSCTFSGNTTAVSSSTGDTGVFLGNIFAGSTTGAAWSTETPHNLWVGNVFGDNTADLSNVTVDATNLLESDPLFTDADANDFTIDPNSPAINALTVLTAKVGLTGSYGWSSGVYQGATGEGGGGGGGEYPTANEIAIAVWAYGTKNVNVTTIEGADATDTLDAISVSLDDYVDANDLLKVVVHDVSGAAGVAQLSDFFSHNTGETYSSAVSGSVVKEIADNAVGSSGFDPNTTPVQVSSTSRSSIKSGLSVFDPNTTPVIVNSTSVASIKSGLSTFDPNTTPVSVASTAKSGYSLTADQSAVTIGTVSTLTGHTPQTGDSYALLGDPNEATLADDLADILTAIGNIESGPGGFDPNTTPVQISSTSVAAIQGDILTAIGEIEAGEDSWDPNVPVDISSTSQAAIALRVLESVVDGTVTVDGALELMVAWLTGRIVVIDNGSTNTVTIYKRDGATVKYTLTAEETTGARSAGAIIDP